MKTLKTKFSLFAKDQFLRCDEKYHYCVANGKMNILGAAPHKSIKLSEVLRESYKLFPYAEGEEYRGIPTGRAYIDDDGDIVDYQSVSLDSHPDRLKYAASNENILISSLRYARSPALLFEDMDLSSYVFSNGYYIFTVAEGWNKRFILYVLRLKKLKQLLDESLYRGIGISSYKIKDLLDCEIGNVPLSTQEKVVKSFEPIERQISQLKTSIIPESEIIDTVFASEFGLDYSRFFELRRVKAYTARNESFSNNLDLRFSAKFHRPSGDFVMKQLCSVTDKKIKHFLAEPIVLGASVSPSDYSDDGEFAYISMATIKNWFFDEETARRVSESYSVSNAKKTVRKGDIILARSGEGTIGKLALITEDIKGVFADFTMRIRLANYNFEFAYYYFRTTFFQYLVEIYKKGLGNNTNIFPIVVKEFPILDVPLSEQQRIVNEIHSKIEEQNIIRKKIYSLRDQIERSISQVLI